MRHQYFAEGLRYHVPGRSPVAGDYEGAAQVLEFFGRLFELSGGTFRVELHDVVANDQHAVALFTVRAERAGKKLAENTVLESHVRDGKLTEAWVYQTDLYAVDEFWSSQPGRPCRSLLHGMTLPSDSSRYTTALMASMSSADLSGLPRRSSVLSHPATKLAISW